MAARRAGFSRMVRKQARARRKAGRKSRRRRIMRDAAGRFARASGRAALSIGRRGAKLAGRIARKRIKKQPAVRAARIGVKVARVARKRANRRVISPNQGTLF